MISNTTNTNNTSNTNNTKNNHKSSNASDLSVMDKPKIVYNKKKVNNEKNLKKIYAETNL